MKTPFTATPGQFADLESEETTKQERKYSDEKSQNSATSGKRPGSRHNRIKT